jgi:hypothetical protein
VIEANNKFLVGTQGERIVMLFPAPRSLAREDALNLAAWIVALADRGEFAPLLEAVKNT